jgi:hypothetical protein
MTQFPTALNQKLSKLGLLPLFFQETLWANRVASPEKTPQNVFDRESIEYPGEVGLGLLSLNGMKS